ncbi:hypothetical protein C4573_02535 [Candidatus Woesearchaeota archaeon]|nr:MAG: hypothetical protein C4573_02535 [Candidatus Woesearchaeota archaeon]
MTSEAAKEYFVSLVKAAQKYKSAPAVEIIPKDDAVMIGSEPAEKTAVTQKTGKTSSEASLQKKKKSLSKKKRIHKKSKKIEKKHGVLKKKTAKLHHKKTIKKTQHHHKTQKHKLAKKSRKKRV